jgi:hypothetical protein
MTIPGKKLGQEREEQTEKTVLDLRSRSARKNNSRESMSQQTNSDSRLEARKSAYP